MADLYINLFDAIVANSEKVGHGVDGYYFGATDEHNWYDLSKAIGQSMVKLGLSKTDEPDQFTDEELAKYWGSLVSFFYFALSVSFSPMCPRPLVSSTAPMPVAAPTTPEPLDGTPSLALRTCSTVYIPSSLRSASRRRRSKACRGP